MLVISPAVQISPILFVKVVCYRRGRYLSFQCKACIDSLAYFHKKILIKKPCKKTSNSHPSLQSATTQQFTIVNFYTNSLGCLSPLPTFFYSLFRSISCIFYSVFFKFLCMLFFARVAHPSYTKKTNEKRRQCFSLRHTSAALRRRRTIGCLKSIQYQVPQALQVQQIKT